MYATVASFSSPWLVPANLENRRQPESGRRAAPQPSALVPSTCVQRKHSQESEVNVEEPEGVRSFEQRRTIPLPEPRLAEGTLYEDPVVEADKPEDVCSLEEPQGLPSEARSVWSSLKPSPSAPHPNGIKRKRRQLSETEADADELDNVRSDQQSRRYFSSSELPRDALLVESKGDTDERHLPPSKDQLTKKNLRLFTGDMDSVASSSRAGSIKRTSSSRSIVTLSESIRSQRSSSTTAHYRYKHLKEVEVYIHVDPPPDIQAAIDDIINVQPSKDRLAILQNKSKVFWEKCKEMVRFAAREDDFVHLFGDILRDIKSSSIITSEKADWRVELKPTIQRSKVNLSFLFDIPAVGSDGPQGLEDTLTPPAPKRYQPSPLGSSQIPPQPASSQPLAPATESRPPMIKTPRPDITIGVEELAVTSALASSCSSFAVSYTQTQAEEFLADLQETTMPSKRDGLPEPALILNPTQCESAVTFPTLIFEGKAYSTGKQVFEAQNQAAVAGAGGLKMQMMLNELVQRATGHSDVLRPLVFSICTEGPCHELWAHYTVLQDDRRRFHMVLVDACNAVLLDQVEHFLIRVDNVLTWTTGPFLESVAHALAKVAQKAMAP